MQIFTPRLSALYESSVKELLDAGVALFPGDYATLYELSRRAVSGGAENPATFSPAVYVGKLCLRRPGIGLFDWMGRCLQPVLEGESDVYWVVGMAWALSHARDRRYIEAHCTPRAVRRGIFMFNLRLPWSLTPEALAHGVTAALGGEVRSVGAIRIEATAYDWGAYVADVCNRYHLDPETVAWKMDIAAVEKLSGWSDSRDGAKRRESAAWRELRAVVDDLKRRAKGKVA